MANATAVIREALAGTGIEVLGSCSAREYDELAPAHLQSSSQVSGARGVVVAGSGGPALWNAFRDRVEASPGVLDAAHPYDAFVGELLARADAALARAGVAFRRYDAAVEAPVLVSFPALGQLAGLGAPGPFGLLIHPDYGPWWALRGAWIVDAEVDAARPLANPCGGCHAPCVGGWERAGNIAQATLEVRDRCVAGRSSRYAEEQIAYHYDRERTLARLRRR